MLVESIVRRTLGIKNHVVNRVMGDEEGLVIELDLWKRRRLVRPNTTNIWRVRKKVIRSGRDLRQTV